MDAFPEHKAPPLLAEFVRQKSGLDYDDEKEEIFLYHGTNCYRRLEITKAGAIEPGRGDFSFFCSRASEAYTYARAACLRDVGKFGVNSLICEPVVLKVSFNARTWVQVDFIQELNPNDADEASAVSLAVIGPVAHGNITDVLHCTHNRRLGHSESVRSFEDGKLLEGIKHLRDKLCKNRVDAWMLQKLGLLTQKVTVNLKGGEVPELTFEDYMRRLKQSQPSS